MELAENLTLTKSEFTQLIDKQRLAELAERGSLDEILSHNMPPELKDKITESLTCLPCLDKYSAQRAIR